MAAFIIYTIRWAVVLTLLYSLYGLLMKRETLHGFNRVVLLVILVASMALPLCQIETSESNIIAQGREMIEYQISHTQNPLSDDIERITVANPDNGVKYTRIPIRQDVNAYILIAIAVYLLGLIICWLRYLISLIALIRLICRGKRIEISGLPKHVVVITHPDIKTPCSWMRWIFLSPEDVNTRAIINHELAHIRYGHSWDMLLCEFTCRMLWCVPFAWMLRQDLRDVHEFQADRRVLATGIQDEEYQLLLIRKATGTGLQPVVNALNQSPIKRRFKMMYTKPSRRWVALKAAYLVPLSALALVAFARPQTLGEIEQNIETTETEMTQVIAESGVIDKVASIAENLGLKEREQELEQEPQPTEIVPTEEAAVPFTEPTDTLTAMADANLVNADLEESRPATEPFAALPLKRANELLDSTMQAVGARKIADGTWIGHFQPSLNNDTVRISQVEYLDKQSRHTGQLRFAHNESDPYAYNMLLQDETRKDRTGYYIRKLYPAKATERSYDQVKNDPNMLSTDEVLVKGLNLFAFQPVAIERSSKETRLFFFLPISTDSDAKFVERLFDTSFADYAIRDVATNDDYMFRSQDKSYFKLVKTVKRDGKDWSVFQTCLIFPPLDKSVEEFKLRPVKADHDHFTIHRIKDIPQKARVITQ